jgi:stage V sporulation protein AE
MYKKRVIFVTDGDMVAMRAVEIAAANIGGRCISASAGNPTILTGEEIVELIKNVEHDPVVVMVDDRGYKGKGIGEMVMEAVMNNDYIETLGVLAVSSKGKDCGRFKVSCSITKEGEIIDGTVDKDGKETHTKIVCGDTLSILREYNDMVIVGIGDPGKMDFNDEIEKGAPITTKALKEVLKRSTARH